MILRRIRGILTSAAIWGVSWAVIGSSLILALRALGHVDPENTPVHQLLVFALAVFGTLGAAAGALFALLVVALGRSQVGRRFAPWMAAVIGAVPAAISTRAAFDQPAVVVAFGLLGCLLAALSAWAAQRAQSPNVSDHAVGVTPGSEPDQTS